jgi:AcrR family transcriptional regulator
MADVVERRQRLLDAVTCVTADVGVERLTVARIIERAGCSRRTFYEEFSCVPDALGAAFERAALVAEVAILPAVTEREWPRRVRAAIEALLLLCDQSPELGVFLFVRSYEARCLQEQREREVGRLVESLSVGAPEPLTGSMEFVCEYVVNCLALTIGSHLREAPAPMVSLTRSIAGVALMPFLGPVGTAKAVAG